MSDYVEVQNLRKGLVIQIYKDPITKQDYEGDAALLNFERCNGTEQQWIVRFEHKDNLEVTSRILKPPFMVKGK